MTETGIKHRGLPRFVEVPLAVCGIMTALPVFVLVAILIKLSSPGPVLFRQRRVGLDGNEFTLLKLRTMSVSLQGSKITAAGDSRVTRVGRLLRNSKIDELPELWNVVKGEMSFVGPRPEVPELVDLNSALWKEVLTHRPGITDPVTLRLRNEEHLLAQVNDKEKYYRDVIQPYKLRGYVRFINNKSWKTDIRIIGRTIKAVALPKTAELPTREEIQWSYAE